MKVATCLLGLLFIFIVIIKFYNKKAVPMFYYLVIFKNNLSYNYNYFKFLFLNNVLFPHLNLEFIYKFSKDDFSNNNIFLPEDYKKEAKKQKQIDKREKLKEAQRINEDKYYQKYIHRKELDRLKFQIFFFKQHNPKPECIISKESE